MPGLGPVGARDGDPRDHLGPAMHRKAGGPSTQLSAPAGWSLFLFLFLFLCAGTRVEGPGRTQGAESGAGKDPFPRRHWAACLSLAYFPNSGFPTLSKQPSVAQSAKRRDLCMSVVP